MQITHQAGRRAVDDVTGVFTLHRSVDQAGWEALSSSVRRGLTFHDWEVTRGKYGTIIAACTRDGADQVTGVVSLNAPRGVQVAGDAQDLKDLALTAAVHIGFIAR